MPLSHTASAEYHACQRKFYLSRVLRLELDAPKQSLRMGAAFAGCLEHGDPEWAEQDYEQALGLAQSTEHAKQLEVEAIQVKALAGAYLQRYDEPRPDIEREIGFESATFGPGYLDGIIHRDGLPPIGIEDKLLTRGFWREADERKLHIDAQVTRYMAAMREAGNPLAAMQYRVTFKPGIKPDSRKNESVDAYAERLDGYINDDPDKTFRVYDLHRTDEQLDAYTRELAAFEQELAFKRRQFKRIGEEAYMPNRGPACTQFGECPFLSLCVGDADAASKYRVKPERVKLTPAQGAALAALASSFTQMAWLPDIARAAGMPESTARSAFKGLESKGLVDRAKHGRSVLYGITDAGKECVRSR